MTVAIITNEKINLRYLLTDESGSSISIKVSDTITMKRLLTHSLIISKAYRLPSLSVSL